MDNSFELNQSRIVEAFLADFSVRLNRVVDCCHPDSPNGYLPYKKGSKHVKILLLRVSKTRVRLPHAPQLQDFNNKTRNNEYGEKKMD